MKAIKYLFAFCITFFSFKVQPQLPLDDFCSIQNTTTKNGEEIDYTVFYSVSGIYVHAGSATFSNKIEKLNGKTVYHVVGEGGTNSSYDWIYKVRDRYESYIDTATMQPLKFIRDVHEGSNKKKENVIFNHSDKTAITDDGTFEIAHCVQDVLSTIYFARNIDFSKYKKNDKVHFKMFLENEVHELYIRYIGKEEIKTRYGKFKAIKFVPLLISGTIFKSGEDMTVWVSDDANRIPVRIESQILIGSIKIDMTGYKNLRNPLSALEKKKN